MTLFFEFGILFWLFLLEFDYCDWTKGKGLMLLIQIIVILKIVPLIINEDYNEDLQIVKQYSVVKLKLFSLIVTLRFKLCQMKISFFV